jgi:16S rRNA (adenine1518-N6/adenine1519-N6)-dimethyltransferase
MKDYARQTRSHLMQLFAQQGLQPRHDLGQNFLVDLNLHQMIARQARLRTTDVVLEVGAGTGGLTMHLLPQAGHVVAVEFDEHVHGHAKKLLGNQPRLTLIHGDALASKHLINPVVVAALEAALINVATEESAFTEESRDLLPDAAPATAELVADSDIDATVDPLDGDNPWELQSRTPTIKLVANLPYNVATPIISNLVASELPWSRMVVTVQWELAERMLAAPHTADYSALTIWLQAQAKLKILRKLPPTVFWPPPTVDSAVLVVQRDLVAQARIIDRTFFHDLIREVFTQRRKRLAGVLATMAKRAVPGSSGLPALSRVTIDEILAGLEIDTHARAEMLTVSQWVQLANQLAATRPPQPTASTFA